MRKTGYSAEEWAAEHEGLSKPTGPQGRHVKVEDGVLLNSVPVYEISISIAGYRFMSGHSWRTRTDAQVVADLLANEIGATTT